MKKIKYIFYSISLLICSIILILISIIQKKSSTNQIGHTTSPTEEVVTETVSSKDNPTNENSIEYCAENKTLWFLNAFFGVFFTSIIFNLSFKFREGDKGIRMFARKNGYIGRTRSIYEKMICSLIYILNVAFISYVIYQHRFLLIPGIFLLLSSVIFLYCHFRYFYTAF